MAVLLPDGDVREHLLPTTLGPRVLGTPLAAAPIPGCPTKGWLRERCQVLPQRPRSHSTSPSPYEDIIRETTFGESAPEDWCQSLDPPRMSIFTPKATQVAPSQDPAALCSTISLSPNSLIRVQSSGSCPVVDKNRYCTSH